MVKKAILEFEVPDDFKPGIDCVRCELKSGDHGECQLDNIRFIDDCPLKIVEVEDK